MNDFLEKAKRFKLVRNYAVITAAVAVFVYIGVEPYLLKAYGNVFVFEMILFVLMLDALVLLFLYEARFSKGVKFLEKASCEITDCGCYLTAREEKNSKDYIFAVSKDLADMGYKTQTGCEVNGLSFDLAAQKGSEYFYLVSVDSADRNDVIAYIDAAHQDITLNRLRSKGNALVVILCNNAHENAVALSKTVSEFYSGKRVLKLGIALVELESGRVYFRGNEPGVIQKLCASFVMNCELPIKDKYKSTERLPFQLELEERLSGFNIKDYNDGKYNER